MADNSLPLVTVIVPVYNQEKYIGQCIESILAQSLQEIEIICVDDGSTDKSKEILEKYAEQDKRIHIFYQENAGAGAARNYGLREATGKYLSFLDSDDFFEPDMLLNAYKQAEKDKADFVIFESDKYQTDEDKYVPNPWALKRADIPPYTPFSYRQLTDNIFETMVGWAWDKLFLHSFVTEHELWFQEQRTTNDMLFVFSALTAAKRISVVYKVLAHQRRGNKKSLSNTRERSWTCFYNALIALREWLNRKGIMWEVERDYINYALHFSLWNYNTLAKPMKDKLGRKLCEEWFYELGIAGKDSEYFYSKQDYAQYLNIKNQYA